MTISMDKQYRTRDGREVRIYAMDGVGPLSIHGSIKTHGSWIMECWYQNGKSLPDYEYSSDLIEVKPRIQHEYWVNVYKNYHAEMFARRDTADMNRNKENCRACVKVVIDCEEGEGL